MMASKSEVLDDLPIDIMVLDVEFTGYLRIARDYMKQMRLADDRRVCEKYIRSCMKMSGSDHYNVKMHRNRFFRYLLKTMKKTVETQALHFVHMVREICLKKSFFSNNILHSQKALLLEKPKR